MTRGEMPALQWLLEDDPPGRDYGGAPYGCSQCPFARAAATHEDERRGYSEWSAPNWGDLDEGHYWCDLLNLDKPVWGENPKCDIKDWRKQARAELREILVEADPRREDSQHDKRRADYSTEGDRGQPS